jgi:hypothetical protein
VDNALHHSSAGATEFIGEKTFIRLPRPPYWPDVAPSDFYLLGILQEKLKNCTARTYDQLKQEMNSILTRIPEAELISVFRMWVRRLQHAIDSGGEYIERTSL